MASLRRLFERWVKICAACFLENIFGIWMITFYPDFVECWDVCHVASRRPCPAPTKARTNIKQAIELLNGRRWRTVSAQVVNCALYNTKASETVHEEMITEFVWHLSPSPVLHLILLENPSEQTQLMGTSTAKRIVKLLEATNGWCRTEF